MWCLQCSDYPSPTLSSHIDRQIRWWVQYKQHRWSRQNRIPWRRSNRPWHKLGCGSWCKRSVAHKRWNRISGAQRSQWQSRRYTNLAMVAHLKLSNYRYWSKESGRGYSLGGLGYQMSEARRRNRWHWLNRHGCPSSLRTRIWIFACPNRGLLCKLPTHSTLPRSSQLQGYDHNCFLWSPKTRCQSHQFLSKILPRHKRPIDYRWVERSALQYNFLTQKSHRLVPRR